MLLSAVLDACVLVPAPVRDTLLRAALEEFYRPYWSKDILAEVERTLISRGMASQDGARKVIEKMREVFPGAEIEQYEHLIDLMQNEPDDHHVLAVAMASGAQAIVTFNLRDFPADALDPYGIEAYSPDQFLCSLFGHSPETMNRVIEEQAAALTAPPMSVDDVLTRLQAQVPNFVRCIQEWRGRLPG